MTQSGFRRLPVAVLAGVCAGAAVVFAPIASAQDRYAAIVIDARTNEILHSDMADEARFPASLTKMMTLYMVFEALEQGQLTMDSTMTASRRAAGQPPSRLGLRRGNTLTVDQAIRALCVLSANDVAVMVAERLGGSEARFSSRMNARARELGMTGTHFANASGLPNPAHRTTARDMAVLSQALWRDFPEYYHYFQTPSYAWRRRSGRNHNRLLGQIEGVDGIKTGYTNASGFNLASSAERDGHRLIAVVMGGETAVARDAQVAYLLEGAFQQIEQRGDRPTYVSLPTTRVDVQILPSGTVTAVSQTFSAEGDLITSGMAGSPESEGDMESEPSPADDGLSDEAPE
jgi:D-alanyl-D-alanine carboxypeptidase